MDRDPGSVTILREVLRPPIMETFKNEWGRAEERLAHPGMDIQITGNGVKFVETVRGEKWPSEFWITREEAIKAAAAIIKAYPLDVLGGL